MLWRWFGTSFVQEHSHGCKFIPMFFTVRYQQESCSLVLANKNHYNQLITSANDMADAFAKRRAKGAKKNRYNWIGQVGNEFYLFWPIERKPQEYFFSNRCAFNRTCTWKSNHTWLNILIHCLLYAKYFSLFNCCLYILIHQRVWL